MKKKELWFFLFLLAVSLIIWLFPQPIQAPQFLGFSDPLFLQGG